MLDRLTGRSMPAMIAMLVAAMVVAACGHQSTTNDTLPAPASMPASVPTSPQPSSGTPVDSPSPTVEDTEPARSVPNVTGKRLSDAEALLGAAGFMSVRAIDASGRGRTILDKNNWIVRRQDPPAGAPVTSGISVTLSAAKPTDGESKPAVNKGVVPDVRCHHLQDAQDALRGAGYYVLVAKDGLGQHRYPLIDRDWIVVGQSATPGSSPKRTEMIQLTVVKYGEPTGSSGCKS